MSDVLGIIIPIGFVFFILFILNQKLGWWDYFMKILGWFKNSVLRWSR